jgi:hypothetical protein
MYYSLEQNDKLGWVVVIHDLVNILKDNQDPIIDWETLTANYKYSKYKYPISNPLAVAEVKRWLDLFEIHPNNKIKPVAIAA